MSTSRNDTEKKKNMLSTGQLKSEDLELERYTEWYVKASWAIVLLITLKHLK